MNLPYPPDTGHTHYDGCWRERGHHNCAVARLDEAEAEVTALQATVARLEAVLSRIANEDYRGNRPISAVLAFEALQREHAIIAARATPTEEGR